MHKSHFENAYGFRLFFKIIFVLIFIVIILLGHNVAHLPTASLSWPMQNYDLIWWSIYIEEQMTFIKKVWIMNS